MRSIGFEYRENMNANALSIAAVIISSPPAALITGFDDRALLCFRSARDKFKESPARLLLGYFVMRESTLRRHGIEIHRKAKVGTNCQWIRSLVEKACRATNCIGLVFSKKLRRSLFEVERDPTKILRFLLDTERARDGALSAFQKCVTDR